MLADGFAAMDFERYKQLDTGPDGGGPEAYLALVRAETPKWADVVRKSGAKID
jgi:hypothetical protein